jgi:hypothetical protein
LREEQTEITRKNLELTEETLVFEEALKAIELTFNNNYGFL